MSKRGRCCNGILTAFRVIQFLLSLTALGCGIWVCYVMFSMSDSAHAIDDFIQQLLDDNERSALEQEYPDVWQAMPITDGGLKDLAIILDNTLVPVLHFLEGTPVRAILISAAALWSVALIVYLHFAHRSATKSTHQLLPSEPNTPNLPSTHRPRRNRRSLRVCLSTLTILLWSVALVCACMLAAEYSVVLIAGGAEMKGAFTGLKLLLQKALDSAFNGDDHAVLRSLDIIDDILTIGALAILAIAASVICGTVEIISLFVACCVSGKVKQKPKQMVQQQQHAQPYQQIRSSEADEALMNRHSAASYNNYNHNYGYGYNPNQTPTHDYSYSSTPVQMQKTPVVAYTPAIYMEDIPTPPAIQHHQPMMTMQQQPQKPMTTTTTTPMPMPVWSRDQVQQPQPQPQQPPMATPIHGTPSIIVSPVWEPAPGPSPTSPQQRFYAYHPETAGHVRRKPLA